MFLFFAILLFGNNGLGWLDDTKRRGWTREAAIFGE